MKVEIKLITLDEAKGYESIFKPVSEREGFIENDAQLVLPRHAIRILGFDGDVDDYFNKLFELKQKEEVVVLSECLDKTIDPKVFQEIQDVLKIQKEENLSIKRFMAHMSAKRLIPYLKSIDTNRFVYEMFVSFLEEFQMAHPGGFNHPDFRRVFIDVVKFSKNHYEKWVEKGMKNLPKIIWYGDASKSQQYFLYFLMKAGLDVLLFHPEGKDNFSFVDEKQEKTQVKKGTDTCPIEAFPTEKRERKATVAYNASREMEKVLHHENSFLYKPWQLRDYIPQHLTLKTTYDELFLLAKEDAFIRPDFHVENGYVSIPTVFAKINGVTRNKKEYWERLHRLTEHPMALTIKQFPFTKEEKSQPYLYHFQNARKNGKLDPEKIISGNWWRYKQLPIALQKGIANAICRHVEKPDLLPVGAEKIEEVKLYLFAQAISIPNEILQLLQKFDYSKAVPKLILYNNEVNGNLSRSDAALLLLLNEIGMDIFVYNPPGHSDLEMFMKQDVFDSHLLDDMVFNQEYQEPTFFGKFIKRLKS